MADKQEKATLPLKVGRHTWVDLDKEYQAFTPALLYWFTNLDRDIIADYILRYDIPKAEMPIMYHTDAPIFNISNPIHELIIPTRSGGFVTRKIDLSRTIYFCPRSIWRRPDNPEDAGLESYLRAQGFGDRRNKSYSVSVQCADIEMLDRAAIQQGKQPVGTIKVASFGIYSTFHCAVWRCYADKPAALPIAVKVPPADLVIKDGYAFWEKN